MNAQTRISITTGSVTVWLSIEEAQELRDYLLANGAVTQPPQSPLTPRKKG